MRFLVDECTGPGVAAWLRSEGHETFSVFDEARGIDDEAVMQKAYNEKWILITNDKDFGEKVSGAAPTLWCNSDAALDERAANKIEVLRRLFDQYPDQLADNFVVVTETRVRFDRT